MTRDLSPAVVAEIAKPSIHPRFFVELDFLSAPVRLWTGLGQFEWDGKTWTGAGDLLGFDEIEEASDGSATTVTLTVSGIPSNLTGPIYQDQWQGRSAYIWFGLLDSSGSIVEEPIMLRQGVMDTLNDADDGKSATFSLAIQTEALDQGNNRSWRLTNEIQQEFFPGDKGLEYTVALQKVPLRWGATQAPVRTIKSFVMGII